MPLPKLHFYVLKPKDGTPLDASTSCHVIAAPDPAEALTFLRAAPPIRGRFEARLTGVLGVADFLATVRGASRPIDGTAINVATALRFAIVEYAELATEVEKATVLDVADKIENRALAFMRE